MDKSVEILKKLEELQERISKIEEIIASPRYVTGYSYDPRLPQVVTFLIDKDKINVIDLQKKFDMGYARSARILDELIELGYIKNEADHNSDRKVNKAKLKKITSSKQPDSIKDPLLLKAFEVIMKFDHASASLLQRRLRIGYAKAFKLIGQLEELGYVGPAIGSLPRVVYKKSH